MLLTSKKIKEMDGLLAHCTEDTIKCWIATRLNGASGSMSSEGNISIVLLQALDEHIKPIIKKKG